MIPNHLEALIAKLKESGVDMDIGLDNIVINDVKEYKSIDRDVN